MHDDSAGDVRQVQIKAILCRRDKSISATVLWQLVLPVECNINKENKITPFGSVRFVGKGIIATTTKNKLTLLNRYAVAARVM